MTHLPEQLTPAQKAARQRHHEHVDAEPLTTIALRGPLTMAACHDPQCRESANLWPFGTEFVHTISTVRA